MNNPRKQRDRVENSRKMKLIILRASSIAVTSLALSAALLLTACARQNGSDKYYLISAQIKLPYWQVAEAGFLRAAKQHHVNAEFVGPETYDPKAEQLEFERVVKANPSGILISVANPQLLKNDIDAAVAAGIPVITMDADSPASKRLSFIGTDNYHAGVMGAEVVAKQLRGKGNVVIFTIAGMANLDDRLRGYREVFAEHRGIKITSVVDIAGNPRMAFHATEQMITKEKAMVNAFVCLEARAGKEVAEALDLHKVTDKTVLAMDTDDETLGWIKKGVIAATIAQKPYTMSYVGLSMLNDLHHHPLANPNTNWAGSPVAPLPAFVDTGASLVDKTNVDALMTRLKSSALNRM
jgi:ribose transport system substrate-binding protein